MEGTLGNRIENVFKNFENVSLIKTISAVVRSNEQLQNVLESMETGKITLTMLAVLYANNPIYNAGGNAAGGNGLMISYRPNEKYGAAIFFGYAVKVVKCDLENGTWGNWNAV